MSSPDTFDRQFRRTARGMRRRPGPQTWDRIEQRLDQRGRGGPRIFGLRPWMIAAVLLLFAGYAALSALPTSVDDVLAQRAQSIEDLDTSPTASGSRIDNYAPLQDGRRDGYLVSRSESTARLAVAPKYRL